ncbi:MAG: Rne/Rng family ribonuclease [Acidobacteriales bacterium]|nr:Rne/Rng family ribonuclease [Terriglobales bacterium]
MSKELFVSSTPHETKVALVEDDQLTEIYFERENEYTLAGSIYKGRVTRVLPGMQSAFVDVGLERDAFLYVSDFMEHPDEEGEFETIPTNGGGRVVPEQGNATATEQHASPEEETPEHVEELNAPPSTEAAEDVQPNPQPASERFQQRGPARDTQDEGRGGRGRRRRGRRGRSFPESKFSRSSAEPRPERSFSPPPQNYQPIILPGESISKYRNLNQQAAAPAATEVHTETSPAEALEHQPQTEAFAAADEEQYEANDEPTEVKRPTEEIDVAAILREAEAERQAELQARSQSRYSISGAPGTVEEEEIEEEELDHPGFMQEVEDAEFDELEEETLGSGNSPAPSGQREEHPMEAASDDAATAEIEEEESESDDEEFSASEAEPSEASESHAAAEESSEGAEPREGANGRAEVRGPSGIQQKVSADRRRGRARRGGRRMRGGPRRPRGPLPQISELLKEGQEILVQIAKEPMGKKGARITSHIALPGRYLVYMPTVNHNGVSRKISSPEERDRLKRIIASERQQHQGGFIVRTAAATANEDDLRADIRFLLNLWTEIRNRTDSSKAPALIYHDLNLVERVLRDQVTEGFSHIWVDSEQEYERILRFVNRFQPSLVKRVKLYTKETPLFEQFSIQDEINKALKSKVWLKSGGYIVINQTEALVAIDVNTGKYVGKTQRLEDTIVKTNVDAIREIVRQIRLRDLGGIIVIDFIDMDERKNRHKVMQALEEALKSDRAPSKALQFNDFGLVAITRKRVKQSLERTLGQPCTYCTGTGLIKSVATVCNEVYVELRKLYRQIERGDVIVRVNPEVAKALKANNARWLSDMEELTAKTVIVKPDPTLHQEQFDIH